MVSIHMGSSSGSIILKYCKQIYFHAILFDITSPMVISCGLKHGKVGLDIYSLTCL